MTKQSKCTFSGAAALWEMNQDRNYHGLILTVDLDRAGAGLCLCSQGELPKLLWEEPGKLEASWFSAALTEIFGEDSQVKAEALIQVVKDPKAVRAQRTFLSGRKQVDMPLPPLTVEGRQLSATVATLDQLLIRHWEATMVKTLQQAKDQLALQDEDLPRRILPVGALAGVYLAEYRLREAFLQIPLLPHPLVRSWGAGEDPARVVEEGAQLFREEEKKLQVLPFTLRLQTHCPVGDQLEPRLLTLAEKGTPYEQLRDVTYVGPVVFGPKDSLVLFADSQMRRIEPGFLRFGPDRPFRCLEVGVGLHQQKLSVSLRDGEQTQVWIHLDIH